MSKRKKIIYIVSNVNKAVSFEWIVERLDMKKIELSFILLGNKETYLKHFLDSKEVKNHSIELKSKFGYLKALLFVIKILLKTSPQVVHTHLRDANLIGLLAAKLTRVKKRIYTRHSAMYNHIYFPHSVKYDKLVNWLSTDIISISESTSYALIKKEKVNEKKIHIIHHGFELKKFKHVPTSEIQKLKEKIGISEKEPIIGTIGRYLKLKGYDYIIPAFKKLVHKHPEAHLIIANAFGPEKMHIQKLLSELPKESYTEITFEENLFALFKAFDLYVFTPIGKHVEAFGQTYVEALAAGVPSVFTKSGIGNQLAKDHENCLLVEYKNAEQIFLALDTLLSNSELCKKIEENGQKSVESTFDIKIMISKLEALYLNKA